MLGNKIFTLETFKSEKLPEFFGLFTCSKPSRTPGWREWELEWSEDGTGVLCVCVPQCAQVITAAKGNKRIDNRCNAILRVLVWSFPASEPTCCSEGWQPRFSHWVRKLRILCQFPVTALSSSEFRGRVAGGVTSTSLCVGTSPWWQCVCAAGTLAIFGSASSSSLSTTSQCGLRKPFGSGGWVWKSFLILWQRQMCLMEAVSGFTGDINGTVTSSVSMGLQNKTKNVCILICQASSFLALPWSKLQRKYTINKPREYCLWVCVYIYSHELTYKQSRLRAPLELWYRWCFQLWCDGHHSLKFWHLWTEPQWAQCWNWYWLFRASNCSKIQVFGGSKVMKGKKKSKGT